MHKWVHQLNSIYKWTYYLNSSLLQKEIWLYSSTTITLAQITKLGLEYKAKKISCNVELLGIYGNLFSAKGAVEDYVRCLNEEAKPWVQDLRGMPGNDFILPLDTLPIMD